MNATVKTGKQLVYDVLRRAGIKRLTRDYRDYERAKKLVLDGSLPCASYDEAIRAIMDYTGV